MDWTRFSNPSITDVWGERQWKREHERLLPILEQAYQSASPHEQKHIEQLEAAFFAGDRAGFVAWAQKVVPGAFSSRKPVVSTALRLPTSPGEEAVDPLPEWWPEKPVYHGSRATYEVLYEEGLCAPVAVLASGDDYGWQEVWRDEVWHSYTHDLDATQKRRFRDQAGLAGRRPGKDAIGEAVALFWVTQTKRVAASFGPVLEVNLAALRYYWWFPDEVLRERSYVFVLPVDCPQALPGAFSLID